MWIRSGNVLQVTIYLRLNFLLYAVQWSFARPPKFLNFIIVGGFVIEKLMISWRKQSAKLRSQVKTFKTKMRMETHWGQGLGVCFVHVQQWPQQCMKQGGHTINISWMLNGSWKVNHFTHHKIVETSLIQKMLLVIQFLIYFFVLSQQGNTMKSVRRSFCNIFKRCIVLVHSLHVIKPWAIV